MCGKHESMLLLTQYTAHPHNCAGTCGEILRDSNLLCYLISNLTADQFDKAYHKCQYGDDDHAKTLLIVMTRLARTLAVSACPSGASVKQHLMHSNTPASWQQVCRESDCMAIGKLLWCT